MGDWDTLSLGGGGERYFNLPMGRCLGAYVYVWEVWSVAPLEDVYSDIYFLLISCLVQGIHVHNKLLLSLRA